MDVQKLSILFDGMVYRVAMMLRSLSRKSLLRRVVNPRLCSSWTVELEGLGEENGRV